MKKSLLAFIILIFFSFSSFILITIVQRSSSDSKSEGIDSANFKVEGRNVVSSPIDTYYAEAQSKGNTMASIGKSDNRPVIVDNFLAKHRSPMSGLGSVFVQVADQYKIDYRLLPAIAFQESTLGKNIPKGSHNAFGWAIYTGESSGAKFHNWQFAIETVAKGLKTDYIDRGLDTPEAIMTRYTDSDGSWAFGVNFAIEEMTPR